SAKSRDTSLSTCTIRNGPNGVGSPRPRISARKVADSRLSRTETMVWFSRIATATPSPAPEKGFGIGEVRGREALGKCLVDAAEQLLHVVVTSQAVQPGGSLQLRHPGIQALGDVEGALEPRLGVGAAHFGVTNQQV